MRIVCISDTHGHYPELPEGDVLIHTGDYSKGRGSKDQTLEFYRWVGSRKFDHVVTVPGNHDIIEQSKPTWCSHIAQHHAVTRLVDQSCVIEGVTFYGSPWQPSFGNKWAFNLGRGSSEIKGKWSAIPENTEVLLTHGPPYNILDLTSGMSYAGCEDLAHRVMRLKHLKLHVFGHIHESYGKLFYGQSTFVNASICSLRYRPDNDPIIIDIPSRSEMGGSV